MNVTENKRSYSLLKTIPLSFYSKALYRDVGQQWPGLGFSYLLLVISLFTLPYIFYLFTWSFTLSLDALSIPGREPQNANYIIDQIPEITISKGEVSVNVPQPYYIRTKETGEILAVIDTTHPVTDWSSQMNVNRRLIMVLGKNQILVPGRSSGGKELSDIDPKMDGIYTNAYVRMWAEKIISYVWLLRLVIVPIVIFGSFLCMIFGVFIYGVIGFAISRILHAWLSYTDCVRIASVAATPGLALTCIAFILHVTYSGWIDFGVDMGYLFYGIRNNKR